MKSGRFPSPSSRHEARLSVAFSGTTTFPRTQWISIRPQRWVLDYLNHGCQTQRIGGHPIFERTSNVAALYPPETEYHEHQEQGATIDESYIQFELDGQADHDVRALLGPTGCCHLRDPDLLLGESLRRLATLLFHRRPRFEWMADGVFLEVIGLVLQSTPVTAGQRSVRAEPASPADDLAGTVEHYIRAHIAQPLRIKHLAAQVGMSETHFAHTYAAQAGETPYRTVLRLKIEAAKELILQNHCSIKETAFRLGFSSEFHFSRAFKNLEGCPPRDFRQSLLKGFP